MKREDTTPAFPLGGPGTPMPQELLEPGWELGCTGRGRGRRSGVPCHAPGLSAIRVQGAEACDGLALSGPGTDASWSTKPHCALWQALTDPAQGLAPECGCSRRLHVRPSRSPFPRRSEHIAPHSSLSTRNLQDEHLSPLPVWVSQCGAWKPQPQTLCPLVAPRLGPETMTLVNYSVPEALTFAGLPVT